MVTGPSIPLRDTLDTGALPGHFRLSAPGFSHGGESRVAQRATIILDMFHISTDQAECMGMELQTVRKTFKYKLMPTPEQEQALEIVLWRCRELYNAGLQEREMPGRSATSRSISPGNRQSLPDIKDVRPEYHDITAQVLQDVLHRLDKAFAAFFRRVQAGEQPGYPRFQGRNRYNSFTYPQVGEHGGAAVEGKFLTLAKIGRIRLRRASALAWHT